MRYMMLIYTQETGIDRGSLEERQALLNGHLAVMHDSRERGVYKSADPLEPTRKATTVRVQNGKTLTTDGPFAETKEQLAGYYILDCKDLDEAIEWAAKIPTGCGGATGCVEIRPIANVPRQ